MTRRTPDSGSRAAHSPQARPAGGSGPTETLPRLVRSLVTENLQTVNPGLRLDKYLKPGTSEQQQQQFRELRLNEDAADKTVHRLILERRKSALAGATCWTQTTSSPLALHLSRASAVENGSICLHSIYGFPYLPGTGLKGLARAWAETVWADSQPEQQAAWDQIHAVFGVGDETDQGKETDDRGTGWKPKGLVRQKDKHGKDIDSAGAVIFYDAWPLTPPHLQIDFATPHHKRYYEEAEPPGDWENPEPAAFLSIPSGMEFQFAIAASARCADPALVKRAVEWLKDALTVLGAGAKTNAGYGRFVCLTPPAPLPKTFVTSEHTLTLTTPGFFAGDQGDPRSCQLRGSTLRGMLRWWWRTLHAGHLAPPDLLRLERAIWGGIAAESDTATASAVQIRLTPTSEVKPRDFRREELRRENQLPWPERGERKTPGLTFVSYGMDEREPKRVYLPPGATWRLFISARASGSLSASEVHGEALNALWLLTHFGGVGAKSGKGFGCLALDDASQSVDQLNERLRASFRHASAIRAKYGTPGARQQYATPGSLIMTVAGTPTEIPLGSMPKGEQGVWAALHRLGTIIRLFCSENKHRPSKRALGTPRNIKERDEHQWEPRHTSPVHYHLFRRNQEEYFVRVIAFPSAKLPNLETSAKYLKDFVERLSTIAERVIQEPPVDGLAKGSTNGRQRNERPIVRPSASSVVSPSLRTGDEVVAVLSEEKTKKGGWKANKDGSVGPIQNSERVPASAKPGDRVRLRLKVVTPSIAFDFLRMEE